MESNHGDEIIIYYPNDTLALDVRFDSESVGLIRSLLAELFRISGQPVRYMERRTIVGRIVLI